MEPKTSPTVLETLATTGGYPTASRVGNVISDPDPTIALTAPATTPAPVTASISRTVTGGTVAAPPGPHSARSAGAGRMRVAAREESALTAAGRPAPARRAA